MKELNPNKARLLLLFTRNPIIKVTCEELEYYTSDDELLIGCVSFDKIDKTFHALLFDRDSRKCYCLVNYNIDLETIEEARTALGRLMDMYRRSNECLNKKNPANDFFTLTANPKQIHPYFNMLLDSNGFFAAAKSVIEEVSYHFQDRDGNFVEQLQSKNGFDARIWELYLWCYCREEDFNFCYDYAAPDFILEKNGNTVAIEAVHINRRQKLDETTKIFSIEEIQEKLENEIPLLYGSSLYSKLKHTYENQFYWDLDHVKGCPLVYAIADFHMDMSMTWSFPGIVSILYGIEQSIYQELNGHICLENESGIIFPKGNISIKPLFLDDQFKHISAVMFSPCGTLPKFNRMGVQAGYGNKKNTLFQVKICYNDNPNAILPNVVGNIIDESSNETWADGIQFFHNPFAEIPLEPNLFPQAGHHFYKDGLLRSAVPHNHIISTMTYNIKNMPSSPFVFNMHSNNTFDDIIKKWRM